jgi:anti-sigma factor RsiW
VEEETMNHKPYREWMHAVLDGALAPAGRRDLEAHLATCLECQATWAGLSEVQRLFKAEPPMAPRPGFSGRFQARLAQRESRPQLIWGAVALGLGAVGASALVVPLGLSLVFSTLRVAQQPATTLALLAGAVALADLLRTVVGALAITARAIAQAAFFNPLAWVAATLALVLTGVWLYLVRKLVPEVKVR